MKIYATLRCNDVEVRIKSRTVIVRASALEDYITRHIAGRQDAGGGDWPVTVNITDETINEWETLISAFYNRASNDLAMWFEVWSPYLTKAYYIVAEPPKNIPMSEMGQNSLQTVEITLSVNDYKGMDTAIEPQ